MSYTALREIELCPLRWGLRHGEYIGLWSGKGYPPIPASATIAGQVVHLALERIVRAVGTAREAYAPGQSLRDSDSIGLVVTVLRRLGGISAVVDGAIREIVSGWRANPRLRPRIDELGKELQRQVPTLRPRVQHFLNRVEWNRLRPESAPSGVDGHEREGGTIRPLAAGIYAEVPLVNEGLGWFGKADLIRVGGGSGATDGDEIIDFKTGSPKPDHAFQLWIYALLWAHDKQRNPAGRHAQKLTVLYDSGPSDITVPTTDEELDGFEKELIERTAAVRAAAQDQPPIARPSLEACEWCDVRHMCPAYWAPATRVAIGHSSASVRDHVDACVQIVKRQGQWSWVALVREVGALSHDISVGASLLLRARPHDEHIASLISVGDRLRIIGAQYVDPSEESGELPVLSLTRATEAFVPS